MLFDNLGVSDAVAIVKKLLCTLLKAVQHEILLLVPILVTHLGLWREWVKVTERCLTCMTSACKRLYSDN